MKVFLLPSGLLYFLRNECFGVIIAAFGCRVFLLLWVIAVVESCLLLCYRVPSVGYWVSVVSGCSWFLVLRCRLLIVCVVKFGRIFLGFSQSQ
jgi:hypothetical protein